EEAEPAVRVALRDGDDEAEIRLDEALLALLRLHLPATDRLEHGAERLGRHVELAQHLLRAAPRLADRVRGLDDGRGRRTEQAARGPRGVLLVVPDAGGLLEDLRRGMPEALLEPPHRQLLVVDQPLRLLQLVDEQRDVLRADLHLEQALDHVALDRLEALLDAGAANLRRPRPVALPHEPLALAREPPELRHLPQERVGALVLLRLAGLDLLGRLLGLVVVAEDVPGLDLVLAELLGGVRHVLERQVEREDALAHLPLAGLDLLGDRDLLLAREEGNPAHLLEVHADGIGGLAGAPLGLLGLGLLLRPLRLDFLLGLLGERRLVDGIHLDVHVAEHRDDLVELLGRGAVAGHLTGLTRLAGLGVRSGARGARVGARTHLGSAGLLFLGLLVHSFHAQSPRAESDGHDSFGPGPDAGCDPSAVSGIARVLGSVFANRDRWGRKNAVRGEISRDPEPSQGVFARLSSARPRQTSQSRSRLRHVTVARSDRRASRTWRSRAQLGSRSPALRGSCAEKLTSRTSARPSSSKSIALMQPRSCSSRGISPSESPSTHAKRARFAPPCATASAVVQPGRARSALTKPRTRARSARNVSPPTNGVSHVTAGLEKNSSTSEKTCARCAPSAIAGVISRSAGTTSTGSPCGAATISAVARARRIGLANTRSSGIARSASAATSICRRPSGVKSVPSSERWPR